MEASGLTTLRTGAVAAVCVKQFSRPGAGVCGLIGAGAQAEAALRAVILLTPFREVRIHASHRHSAVRLAEKIQTHFETVTVHENARDVIVGSDLVVTATTANAPLVDRDWIAPGTTIISLGSFQELDDQLVLGADKLIVDSWVQCAERGELARLVKAARLFRQDVFAEIGEVLTGRKPGREGEQETILIVPIGLATHDLALAKLAYNRLVGAPNATTFRFL
jgi:ornithine cyclodeaminase/alanine dehydrogenase